MGDTEAIKQAFRDADLNKDGRISRQEMSPLMMEVCGFEEEEVNALFDEVDRDGSGKVSYEEFIDFVMGVENEGCEGVEGVEGEEGEGGEEEEMGSEYGSDCCQYWRECDDECHAWDDWEGEEEEMPEMDWEQEITRNEFLMMAGDLELPVEDAGEIYDYFAAEYECEQVFLSDLLLELEINFADAEQVQTINTLLETARQRIAEGEAPPEAASGENAGALNSAMDRISSYFEEHDVEEGEDGPDVQGLLENGDLVLSNAEAAAIAQVGAGDLSDKIKNEKENPSMISATAGYHECVKRCSDEVKAIIEKCRAEDTKFTDPEWDVQGNEPAVLWVDKEKAGYDCTVEKPRCWKRLTEVVSDPVLMKDPNRPAGIQQGAFGDCWLLGAMDAVVARDARSVKKLFVKYDFEVGVFGVRFCKDGEWCHIIIDDYVPCKEDEDTGEMKLCYASSKDPQEVWCPLLEKAFVKLHTCYEMCDGGYASEAIFCFFGGVCGAFDVKPKHEENPSSYFKRLQKAKNRGFLLHCGFEPREQRNNGRGPCGEGLLPCGLVDSHAYSVLRVVEAQGNQLLCIRNPWGSGEWTGKWSDRNADGEWTDEMIQACKWTAEDDGTFWMSMEDFFASGGTCGIEYARTFGPKWKKLTLRSRFAKKPLKAVVKEDYEGVEGDEMTIKKGEKVKITEMYGGWLIGKRGEEEGMFPTSCVSFKNRFVSRFDLQTVSSEGSQGKLVIMLIQPTVMFQRKFYKRKEDGLNAKVTDQPEITLTVVSAENKLLLNKSGCDRIIWGEFQAPPTGSVLKIYATSVLGLGQRFSIRVYAKRQVLSQRSGREEVHRSDGGDATAR